MHEWKKKPFELDDEQYNWVRQTLSMMTLEEKIGQLFCPLVLFPDQEVFLETLLSFHVGGLMIKTADAQTVRHCFSFMKEKSRIPPICAANLEYGSSALIHKGTNFGQQMAVGATENVENAYRLGLVSCTEAAAVGCTTAFAPVADLDLNWRNPIVNVRSYGSNPSQVLRYCRAYLKGAKDAGVEGTVKHFPGDGVDEVDQHLQTSVNSLSCTSWSKSYGWIYRGLIRDGLKAIMVGHIDQPAWRKRLGGRAEGERVPASLSKTLVSKFLRQKLGFNGLVITDASIMLGFTTFMKRRDAVPAAIAAGCDMLLFNKDLAEDYAYMKEGITRGILTVERIDEAVGRILAYKASLHLYERRIPDAEALECIGCPEHHIWAKKCAEEAITLVRDEQKALPLSCFKTPRLLIEVVGQERQNPFIRHQIKTALEKEGFNVTLYEPEQKEKYRFGVKALTSQFDAVIYLVNIENASNQTTNRIQWKPFLGQGDNMPWFVQELPVIFVSLSNPYHDIDVPMMKTLINCYSNNEETIIMLVEKIVGKSNWSGKCPTKYGTEVSKRKKMKI